MRITEQEKEDVRARAEILEVIGGYVELKKQGASYVGLCPFHNERTPSFIVTPAKRLYKCFGCGAGGDVIKFVMGVENLTFPEAVRALQVRYGLRAYTDTPRSTRAPERPREAPKRKPEKKPQETPKGIPEDVLRARLVEYRAALRALDTENVRGLPVELLYRYGCGYAAAGRWLKQKDKWFPRIVAPGTTTSGHLVNLYGRADHPNPMIGDFNYKHRHLQSPRGTFNAQALCEGDGPLAVCEGVFDALSIIHAGHPRTVAIFGANDMPWHALENVGHLVFCLDNDATGQAKARDLATEAALRGYEPYILPAECYGGRKDANDALQAGTLNIAPLLELAERIRAECPF